MAVLRRTILLLLFAFMSIRAFAQQAPDAHQVGRAATAVIINTFEYENLDGTVIEASRGSGFCITKSGYFITNAHVLTNAPSVRMGIQTGPHEMRYFDGYPVDIDRKLDLALIRVDEPLDFKPLKFVDTADLRRGMRVIAFGFPAEGNDLAAVLADNWVTVHAGMITQLFGEHGHLEDVEANTGMWQGASGGPVLNARGELVGVTQKGKLHSNLNLAISSNIVAAYLTRPKLAALVRPPRIRFDVPRQVADANLTHPQAFAVKLLPGLDPIGAADLALEFSALGMQSRSIHGTIGADGAYTFHTPLVPGRSGPHTVRLTVFKAVHANCTTVAANDFPVDIGGRSKRMSEISRIDTDGVSSTVTLLNGEVLHGQLKGLEHVPMTEKGNASQSDLSGSTRILVHDNDYVPDVIRYTLAVKRKYGLTAVESGDIEITGQSLRRLGQGTVLACGSAWATNNTGRATGKADALSPSTRQYIRNIMDVFVGGAPANVLVYSDHWTFGEPFREVLRALGHTVTVTLKPGPLDQYDAVFVGGHDVDQDALADYVLQGGKIYLSGGEDAGGGKWNSFLGHFGLLSQADAKPDPAPGSAFVYAPLFDGVSALTLNKPYQIVRTSAEKPDAQTICNQSETNLWAIYRAGDKLAPSPAQIAAVAAREAAAAQKIQDHQDAIAHRTVDAVLIGNQSSEQQHHLKGDNLLSGEYDGKPWRAANRGAGFSYTLKLDSHADNNLLCTFAWTDGQSGECVIYLDDMFLGRVDLREIRLRAGYMLHTLFELPSRITAGKESVVVRFQAEHGNKTPEVSQCEIQRSVPGFSARPPPLMPDDVAVRSPPPSPPIDTVKIGDPDSERAHNLQGDNTRISDDSPSRAAFDGGWFSYTLKVDTEASLSLHIAFAEEHGAGHDFDIFVDGVKLVSVFPEQRNGHGPHQAEYPIPESWTKNKAQIEVRFKGSPGNTAGPIYDCRLTKR